MTPRQKWWRKMLRNERTLERIAIHFQACTYTEWDQALISHDINRIGNILQRAWENAPDEPWIHNIAGWGLLCDLCADLNEEVYV